MSNLPADLKSTAKTVSGRLLEIRSDLLRLVTALNQGGCYKDAADAQALVIAVHQFEDDNNFDRCAWPPEPDQETGGLIWVENYGE